MTILVDGYNVLRRLFPGPISSDQRNTFISRLRKYASVKGHTVILVFDGGSLSGNYQEPHGSVMVYYTGGNSADDVLVHTIHAYPKDNTVLVSDDRQLVDRVAQLNYVSIGVEDFYRYVQQARTMEKMEKATPIAHQQIIKTTASDNSEIDTLLMQEKIKIDKKQADQVFVPYADERSKISKKKS